MSGRAEMDGWMNDWMDKEGAREKRIGDGDGVRMRAGSGCGPADARTKRDPSVPPVTVAHVTRGMCAPVRALVFYRSLLPCIARLFMATR